MTVLGPTQSASFLRAEAYNKVETTREPYFVEVREVLRTLRLRWKLIGCCVLIFVGIALVWLLVVPPKYAAVSQLFIDPRDLQVVKDAVSPQSQANDASLVLIDSEVRVLTSDTVLKRVVDKFGLARDPEFTGTQSFLGGLRSRLSALFGLAQETDAEIAALRALRDRTAASRLERSFVVQLSVTTQEREKSVQLAEAIAETYLAADTEARARATRSAGATLAGRLDELREAVRRAENKAQSFRAANNIVGTRTQLVSEQELTQVNDQLGAARVRVAELRGRLDRMEALAKGTIDLNAVNEVLQSTTVAQLRTQLAQWEAALADSVTNLGPRHPTVRRNEVLVRGLRRQIEAEVKRITIATRNDYAAAVANEAALAARLEKLKSQTLRLGQNFVRLRELDREVEASRALYESFLTRTRELKEQQRLDTSTSRIISPASPPARRSGPRTSVLLIAALVAGFGVGAVGGLSLDYIRGRVGSRRRLEQITGLTAVASLPRSQPAFRLSNGKPHPNLAYEVVLRRLGDRLRRESSGRPLAMVVTSADDAVGKSLLALSLASYYAQTSDRVLLIDGDPEAATTRKLGVRPAASLTDVVEARALMSDAIVKTPHRFSFLPFPERAIAPAVEASTRTIFESSGSFDFIVFDAGVIGVDLAAERLALDHRFSTVLFTASAVNSCFTSVKHAIGALGHDPRLRVVLTDADMEE